jgi:cell division inhibitor SepF
MALRDTWHRTLVYFGLAEDEAYEDDYDAYSEPEVQLQDSYRERPTVRRLPQSRRRRDDYDDIFAEDESSYSAASTSSPPRTSTTSRTSVTSSRRRSR